MPRATPKRDRVRELAEQAILSGQNPSTAAIARATGRSYQSVKTDLRTLRADGKLPMRMKADFLKTAAARQGEREFVEGEATEPGGAE